VRAAARSRAARAPLRAMARRRNAETRRRGAPRMERSPSRPTVAAQLVGERPKRVLSISARDLGAALPRVYGCSAGTSGALVADVLATRGDLVDARLRDDAAEWKAPVERHDARRGAGPRPRVALRRERAS